MKLEDLKQQTPPQIYVDLDGVLADFDRAVKDQFGYDAKKIKGGHNDDKMWRDIMNLEKLWRNTAPTSNTGWFYNLDPMADANQLWNYVSKHNPIILTATGTSIKNAGEQKKAWVSRHFGNDIPVITAISGKHKHKHAKPGDILIDDRMKSIGPWRAAKGNGILHKSAAETIAKLKDLGL